MQRRVDVLKKDLPSWRLVFDLFLREDVSRCKALLLRTLLRFDLRLVRLVLVSVFRCLLVLRSISHCAPFSMFVSIQF